MNPASLRSVVVHLSSCLALGFSPALASIPASIYQIKMGTIPEGESVSLSDALITARSDEGCFLQVKQGDNGYTGADYSGIFLAGNFPVLPGQRIQIPAATVVYVGDGIRLTDATPVISSQVIEAPPAPVVVTAAQIATGGPRSHQLEGVLVQVNQVTVASLDPAGNEFLVDAGLRVDDLFYLANPFPWEGRIFTSVTGPLAIRDGVAKVEPRDAADLPNPAGPPPNATLQSYQQWAASAFLTGGDALTWAEPHHDGVSNLLKYAFNLDGSNPDRRTLTPGTGIQGLPAIIHGGSGAGTTLSVEYLRRRNSGLVYTPQLSSTLSSFIPFSAAESVTTIDGAWERVVVAESLGSTPPDRLFASVKVELPTTPDAGGFTLTPNAATLPPNASTFLTITLGAPAVADTTVSLSISNPLLGTAPPSVTVPTGQSSATFAFTGSGSAGEVTVTATLGAFSHQSLITLAAPSHLVINEVDYDNPGTDTAEFVEIYNPTSAPINLANQALVFINGATASEYYRVDLAPCGSIPANGYLVIAGGGVTVPAPSIRYTPPNWSSQDMIQNGAPDGLLLLNTSTQLAVDAFSYEGAITAATVAGTAGTYNLAEGTVLPASVADTNSTGSLSRAPNGSETDNAAIDWTFSATPTPGGQN
ncbi:lamin tail domain-containing protein [Haloferula sp. BvORR071]|uniref:lamin tail domain-containing protein n=1 Tax=Haloferula sp. BvORR071 TaxID=1396141 RepID=UPI0005533F6E|nr:lamin tail domain-containing protein [Haloferula sp. BvORR071]